MLKFASLIAKDPFQFKERLTNNEAEIIFKEIYQSKLHSSVLNLIDSMMKLSGFQIGPAHGRSANYDDDEDAESNSHLSAMTSGGAARPLMDKLTIYNFSLENSPRIISQNKTLAIIWTKVISRKPTLRILSLLIHYYAIKLILITYYYYQHDLVIKSLTPNLSLMRMAMRSTIGLSTMTLESCAIAETIKYDSKPGDTQQSLVERLDSLRATMERIGNLVVTIPGIGIVGNGIICCLPLVFYYFSRVMFKFAPQFRYGVRVDYLAFLVNPLEQRQRVFAEMDQIILGLLQSALHRVSRRCSRLQYKEQEAHPDRMDSQNNSAQQRQQQSGHSTDRHFVELLIEMHDFSLVQPIVLTPKWHHQLMKFTQFMLIFGAVVASVGPYAGQLFVGLFELFERARLRLKNMDCNRWHPNGTLIMWSQLRFPRIESMEDRELYETHDGGLGSLFQLAFSVECKNYFTAGRLLYLVIEYPIISVICGIWASFWANLFISSSLEKIIWLNQIRAQLDVCKLSLERIRLQRHPPSKQEMGKILKQTTISYINFELFRKQSPQFQTLNNFLIQQMFGLTAQAFMISYFVATSIDARYQIMIIYALAAVGLTINFYLLLSSYRLKLVEKLMRELAKVLAHSTDIELISRSYSIELWRRQLLADADCKQNFSSRLFLTYISWETLLSFNIYLFALWLILLK